MTPTVRTWCTHTDTDRLQAGLGLAAILLGDGLDAPRSRPAGKRVVAFLDGVSCAPTGHWNPPLPSRVFHQDGGVLCSFEDGTAFHIAPLQGGRAWRACADLFVGPEVEGGATGWTEADAAQAFALAQRAPKACLPTSTRDWLLEPTTIEWAMPAPAKNRPATLVAGREAGLLDLVRLVLGAQQIDLVFSHEGGTGPVRVGTDLMGIGIPTLQSYTFAEDLYGRDVLDALGTAAARLFPGRLGRCRLPHGDLPDLVQQAFARVRAADGKDPVSAHARMGTLKLVHTSYPELLPFLPS
jgi:hypothetical protein